MLWLFAGFPRVFIDMLLRPLYSFIKLLLGNTDIYNFLAGGAGVVAVLLLHYSDFNKHRNITMHANTALHK